jgi:hypothetical protein
LPRSDYLSRYSSEGFKVTAGAVFSAIGGSIVLIQGLVILLNGEAMIFSIQNGTGSLPFGLSLGAAGVFEIAVGACMLGGTYLVASSVFKIIGAIVVLIFSIVSVVIGGGWVVGLVLGLLGGILGLFRK